jgi:hypothetical protein
MSVKNMFDLEFCILPAFRVKTREEMEVEMNVREEMEWELR